MGPIRSAFAGLLFLCFPAFAETPAPRLLLGEGYALEISISFHAGLLHWLDSLAAVNPPIGTAGKTVPAHRLTHRRIHGNPSENDLQVLKKFRDARVAFFENNRNDVHGLTIAFIEAGTLDEALARTRDLLEPASAGDLQTAIRYFAPRYRKIWNGGSIPEAFVSRSLDSRERKKLTRFLLTVAEFYGVRPERHPVPRLSLIPVRPGFGTHAQAIGRLLLLEVRDREDLLDEIEPIVHENAHFLFNRMDPSRLASMERIADQAGPQGRLAWSLLKEALPTAIAQGEAGRRFHGSRWSSEHRWYHIEAVDAYAKRIFPLVKQALRSGRSFDEPMLRELLAARDS